MPISYGTAEMITFLEAAGYRLVENTYPEGQTQFDFDTAIDQEWVITLKRADYHEPDITIPITDPVLEA